MHSGSSTSNTEKLRSWLRYYEDLGIRAFYRDRVPRRGMDETVTAKPEKETAQMAAEKAPPPAPSRAALPKLNLMGRAPSLFEAAERVEGDSLELISGELAG